MKICIPLSLLTILLINLIKLIKSSNIIPLSQKPIEPYSLNIGEYTYYKFYFRT